MASPAARQRRALFLSFTLVPLYGCICHVSEMSVYHYCTVRTNRQKISCCGNQNFIFFLSQCDTTEAYIGGKSKTLVSVPLNVCCRRLVILLAAQNVSDCKIGKNTDIYDLSWRYSYNCLRDTVKNAQFLYFQALKKISDHVKEKSSDISEEEIAISSSFFPFCLVMFDCHLHCKYRLKCTCFCFCLYFYNFLAL